MKSKSTSIQWMGKAVISGGVLIAVAAAAADFTWLGTPASGNWNTVDTNWTAGVTTVWASAPTNNALFGASDTKSVTAEAVTLKNLTISADGYAIGGGPLLMYGGPTVGAGLSAVLTASLTNNVGFWEKKGTGTLVLDPGAGSTNYFSTLRVSEGLVHITGGTHEIATNDLNNINLGFDVNVGAMLVSGGKVRTTGPGYSAVRGSLLITNGIVDLSSCREFLNAFNGAGTTTVSGSGLLDVTQLRVAQSPAAAAQNAVNVNTGGTIRLSNFYLDTSSLRNGTINFNGGTLVARFTTNQVDFLGTTSTSWTGIVVNVLAGGAVIDNNGVNLTVRRPLTGSPGDGGLTKKGAGLMYLRGASTYNGGTVVLGGSLNITDDNNLGAVPPAPATNLTFGVSGALQSSANNALAANRIIRIPTNVTVTFDTQTSTQTVYGVVAGEGTNSVVVKNGAGMLILDPGAASVNTFGTLQPTAGTLVIASGTNVVTCPNKGQNAPGLHVSGGTLLLAGGVLKTMTGLFVNVDGGHLLVTNGVADVTSCNEILNGIGSTYGYTTVSGSGVIIANVVRVSQNTGNPSNTVVSVNTGGVMRLNNFYIDTNFSGQKGMIFLNGGTVEPRVDTADFLGTATALTGAANDRWLTNIFVHVREGGAIFNTAGKSISVKQPLYTGAAADGGLTKRGNGTLTLLNTNTYNGATAVQAGTLRLGVATNTLLSSGSAFVSSNAVLDINGKVQSLAGLGGGGTVTNGGALAVAGAVMPGDTNVIGTLTLAASPAALSGALTVDVAANGACDRLHVRGDLDLSGLSLNVADTGLLSKFWTYTVATYTGALSGAFTSANLPLRWNIKYDTAAKRVYLVYNPGTLLRVQ